MTSVSHDEVRSDANSWGENLRTVLGDRLMGSGEAADS